MNDLKNHKGQREKLYERLDFIFHSKKITKKEKKYIIIEIANILTSTKSVSDRYKKIKKIVDEFQGINNAKSSQLKDNITDMKHQIEKNDFLGTRTKTRRTSNNNTRRSISNLSNRSTFGSNPLST